MLMAAGGLLSTLLGLRAEIAGLPTVIIGTIAASYFFGFIVGSRLALRALGKVGHIRVYSALAASLTVALLAIGLTDSWVPWMLLRFITGVCFAGQYVVAESWLNELGTNQNRGRLLGVYSLVVAGAFAAGQSMLLAGLAVAAALLAVSARPALVIIPLVSSLPVGLSWIKLQGRLKRDGRIDQLPGVS
jgi:MFS family permease